MGKASMCIRMLQILSSGRVYKISELAELLDTNPRNIIEYKKELDEVAFESGFSFYIKNIPGRYGGYCLDGEVTLPSLKLTPEQKESLDSAFNYLLARNDFMGKDEFQITMAKIYSSIIVHDLKKEEEVAVINRFPLVMDQKEIEYRHNILKTAIKLHKKVKFTYLSQKNVVKEHVFSPYEVFMYNNAWFVIGWLKDICWFKLNRIQSIQLTEEKFTVWKYYNRNDYLDEFGFKSNGEWYHVEFIASGIYASLCKERIYGKNQVVEVIDDEHTKMSVDMQNKGNILTFILGFGKDIQVLEPKWLKDELKETAEHIMDLYN